LGVYEDLKNKKIKLAVIGLGYVGLPLAVEFGKVINTIGFDVKEKRISELREGADINGEITPEEIKSSKLVEFTSDAEKLKEAEFIITAVPTPITKNKIPDLSHIETSAGLIGKNLSPGSIIVLESTVYPGVTEEIFAPVIEKFSNLKRGRDFKLGYSPERINPGDKEHTIANTLKVISAEDPETLDEVEKVYSLIVKAGTYRAESIKCAEAAKVIENTQRDLNIALMNELSLIFHRLDIDTRSVLMAAGTKWNFIKMTPGLVGGHCIGVDPYYLTYKAEETGYHPQVILAGRKINDYMGAYVAEQTVKHLIEADKTVKGSSVIIFGFTFKENISDTRNTRVIDLVRELREYGLEVAVCDPLADEEQVKKEYGIKLVPYDSNFRADCAVVAINHDCFVKTLTPEVLKRHLNNGRGKGVVIDVKGMFKPEDFRDAVYWRL
jgi:UDP-N-acetyl-D-glucosamine/UDP-N-acetyl-D-galactosamine dehydrogenase